MLHATARGIRIDRLSTELAGDIDLQGLLARDHSPVCNTICRPVPVMLERVGR